MGKVASTFVVILLAALVTLVAAREAAGDDLAEAFAGRLSGIYAASEARVDPAQPSAPAFETLRGNGTRAGYILGHGSIVPGSESVTVGGSKKVRSRDYHIDYAGGSVVFAESVRQSDPISVTYRYALSDKVERTLVGLPGLPVLNTKNTSLNLTYAYRTGNGASGQSLPDLATYGFNSTTKFGAKSSLKTMLYFSSPQKRAAGINHLAPKPTASGQAKVESDEIIVQEGEFGIGGLKLKLGYQDVGADFAGFAALAETGAAPAHVLAQLAKEKGLKRLGMQAELGLGRGMSLTASSNQIEDKSGAVESRFASVGLGKIGLSYFHRSVDQGFSRIGSLSGDDLTRMALEIRQQFDPNASSGQVTDNDRKQILSEAGIDRTNMRMSFSGGTLSTELGMLSIADGRGSVERRSARIAGKNYSLSWMDQEIDDSFEALGRLAPVEKGEFGNERGMHRTNIAGALRTGSGDVALGFSKVTDGSGASVLKRSLGFTGKTLSVRANFQEIDSQFDRLGDLVDPDRQAMQQDRGFRRTDIDARLKLSERLGVESYYQRASGEQRAESSERRAVSHEQLRNKIEYSTGFGARVIVFRDESTSTSADGKKSGYLHQWIKLDHKFSLLGGLAFDGLRDVKTTLDQGGNEITATISQMHLESDKSRRSWASADRKMVDFGNGKFEDTQSFNLSSKPLKRLSLTGALTTVDRGSDGSDEIRAYGLQWAISSRMSFSAEVMDKAGNKSGVSARRSYALSGDLAERLGMFRSVKLSASRLVEEKDGALLKEMDGVKIEAGLFGGNFLAEYAALRDAAGNHPVSRGFSFASSQDEKNRLRFGVAYKSRDLGPGDPFAVRAYNLDYRLSSRTSLSYTYFSYREKPDGKVEPVGGAVLKLASVLGRYSVTANFKEDENYADHTDRKSYGLGISGKLGSGALIEIGCLLDDAITRAGRTEGHTYRLKYDHQVSADHFLTFTSEYKVVDAAAPGRTKDLIARLDLKRVFN